MPNTCPCNDCAEIKKQDAEFLAAANPPDITTLSYYGLSPRTVESNLKQLRTWCEMLDSSKRDFCISDSSFLPHVGSGEITAQMILYRLRSWLGQGYKITTGTDLSWEDKQKHAKEMAGKGMQNNPGNPKKSASMQLAILQGGISNLVDRLFIHLAEAQLDGEEDLKKNPEARRREPKQRLEMAVYREAAGMVRDGVDINDVCGWMLVMVMEYGMVKGVIGFCYDEFFLWVGKGSGSR
ncbi:hypothetical protein BJX61DRAFT_540506 [Aspergillus egyptiacus]|nr:hypothetical protein BJX61DRAFT_540506 [Aspergillus egyptiacus]